ncbi:hypothetical protein CFOL_v3_35943 [Cephalotus follicularis]|uniref:Exo_endo_phos domain-containing protein n=1 Tax=Cephalotus follicularis TaxID=3775 RepID=A0A1Q3DJJ2_CEPFO|nr:hypothetical protein CFOL_v3_35943 [Cephalotus follicularis]
MRIVACNFSSLPWAILGDFNVSMLVQEQLGGKPGLSKSMMEFEACIRDCEIEDIRQTRCFYTWNNKRSGRELITKKLDRVMGNWLWFQQVGHLQVHFCAPGISDHSPAELHLRSRPPGLGRAFKFLNIWASYPSFLGIVRQVWAAEVSGTPLEVVAKKLKLLKHALQRLHGNHFKNPTSLVSHYRLEVEDVQARLEKDPTNPQLRDLEKELVEKLSNAGHVEEAVLRQKSRIHWLKLGDSNTAFFHKVCKVRQSKNFISHILNEAGQWVSEPRLIGEEGVSFFSHLFKGPACQAPVLLGSYDKCIPQVMEDDTDMAVSRVEVEESIWSQCNAPNPKEIPKV